MHHPDYRPSAFTSKITESWCARGREALPLIIFNYQNQPATLEASGKASGTVDPASPDPMIRELLEAAGSALGRPRRAGGQIDAILRGRP